LLRRKEGPESECPEISRLTWQRKKWKIPPESKGGESSPILEKRRKKRRPLRRSGERKQPNNPLSPCSTEEESTIQKIRFIHQALKGEGKRKSFHHKKTPKEDLRHNVLGQGGISQSQRQSKTTSREKTTSRPLNKPGSEAKGGRHGQEKTKAMTFSFRDKNPAAIIAGKLFPPSKTKAKKGQNTPTAHGFCVGKRRGQKEQVPQSIQKS